MSNRFDWFGRKDTQVNYGGLDAPPVAISDAATSGTVYKCYTDHEPTDDNRIHVQRTVVAADVTTIDHTVVKWRHRGSTGIVYKPIHERVQSDVNDAWYAALPVLSATGVQTLAGYKDSALPEQGVAATASSEDVTLAFALKSGSSLPAGVSLNATTGALTGTPTTVATGSFYVVISADGNTDIDPIEVKVEYEVVLPTIVADAEQSITGYQGTALADQGVEAVTVPAGLALGYAVKDGSTLPAGVSLNASTGELTGTPSAAGDGSFIIVISEDGNDAEDVEVEVTYEIALPVINAVSPQTMTGTEGVALDGQGVVASSTPSGLTLGYALKDGSTLPAGVSLNASTGALTGTPSAAGDGSFIIVVSDAAEDAADVEVEVTYEIALPESPPEGTEGIDVSGAGYTASNGTYPLDDPLATGTARTWHLDADNWVEWAGGRWVIMTDPDPEVPFTGDPETYVPGPAYFGDDSADPWDCVWTPAHAGETFPELDLRPAPTVTQVFGIEI